jgi:hypothetical protein
MSLFFVFLVLGPVWLLTSLPGAQAQETDITQTPNIANAGIKKSLADQVGAGRGDINTPDSSLFLIGRDPFRSIARGRQLFQRKYTVAEGFGPRTNDGIGNGIVDIASEGSLGAGLVDSCAGCHGRPKGSAGFGGNVFTRPDSRDAPHLFGLGIIEMLGDEITSDLRAIRDNAIQVAQQRNRRVFRQLTSKGINFGTIRVSPNGSVDTSQVEGVDPDLRVRPLFHQGGTISIREFVVGALNAEMGLEAFDPDLALASSGGRVVTPSGMVLDGELDQIEAPPVSSAADDFDLDGVANEVPVSLVDHLEFYLLNYFTPGLYQQTNTTRKGKRLFRQIRCTGCHIPDLVLDHDRRVADVETVYDRQGVFNDLFATATPLFTDQEDGTGHPSLKRPLGQAYVVKNIYADFKRHDLGTAFHERNFDGTITKVFVTEPLWGVGSTPSYGHDGRSINLREVIRRHGGEARQSKQRFFNLSTNDQHAILEFHNALVLFGPPDTSSNLNPGDANTPGYPQNGHGSIDLSVLFNDPSDLE